MYKLRTRSLYCNPDEVQGSYIFVLESTIDFAIFLLLVNKDSYFSYFLNPEFPIFRFF